MRCDACIYLDRFTVAMPYSLRAMTAPNIARSIYPDGKLGNGASVDLSSGLHQRAEIATKPFSSTGTCRTVLEFIQRTPL